ncbi:MAG: ABC transporter permease [Alphaproteobacteria bacterium]|nr:ABC transporter permease [Alphaproteobacteria bacterium]HPF45479.1 ABC transporter permease [Emcibacteraceae bacterium]
MLKSYLTSTIRDIFNNKGYSAINIIGLAVAMAACLLIFLFVTDELGYDKFIPDADRTYRIEVTAKSPNRADEKYPWFMGAYGPLIKERSPDVEDTTRYQTNRLAVGVGDRFFYENITFSDPNFLDFMGLSVPPDILNDQQAIVITQKIANKYFPNEDAVGKTMTIAGTVDYRVAYVMPDLPHKSHLAIDMVAPYNQEFFSGINTEYLSMNNATYVRMKPGRSPELLRPLIATLIDENVPQNDQGAKASSYRIPTFIAVQDIYLKSPAGVIGKASGDITVVIGFISVAILIVVIATVNYINLATARAIKRAREVGIRKVMGATRKQLISQFLGESVMITLIAAIFALAFVEIILPTFNAALDRQISFEFIEKPLILVLLLMITALIGIIAGLYPAFYLSAFNPATVLKSDQGDKKTIFLRQFLVFLQFSIAITLIAGTTVVVRQTMFATNMDPGYDKEGVLTIHNLRSNNLLDKVELLDQQLSTIEGITSVAASQFVPTDLYDFTTGMSFVGKPDAPFAMSILSHEAQFFDLYRLRLKAGRKLEKDRLSDKITQFPEKDNETVETNVLLNETAARILGFSKADDALGQQIKWDLQGPGQAAIFTVVGVIEDFHLRSIHNTVRPMLYLNAPAFYRTLSLRFSTNDFPALISKLERKWSEIAPGVPLGYQILSEQVDQFYSSENKQMKVFVTFAILAIIISAIGLLGLTAFSAERRTREIGIRKVLGARTFDIIRLMLGQFSRPVLVANLVALPIAWFLMDRWLSDFEYRIDLNILWFIGAGLAALLIAWITVIGYSYKAAQANPADALRYE